ncbi:MAG: hypothetical protein M1822_004763 [Bathelium mastoideum]|nr:MAG: hypothetical protein M1822_004763 [Bathelium mastoideum]
MTDPASTSGGSLSLVSSSHKGFSTSGTINWNSLVDTTFNATVGILSRVSAAGVDPYTLVVAQALGSQFQLTKLGHERIITALEKLASFSGIGNALSFGFGIDHLVRVMAKSEQGLLCLALCGSLNECYSTDLAAEILIEMVKTAEAPASLQPSILQWKAFLQACAGIFSTTKFPLLLDGIMRLHPSYHIDSFQAQFPQPDGYQPSKCCSSPQSLAAVLLALARVTHGTLASITVVGGADAGFIVAIADWFFDLSVEISDAKTGEILYKNHQRSESVQLSAIFTETRQANVTPLQLMGKTYRLEDVDMVMRTDEHRITYLSGRVQWAEILHTLCGSTFEKLLGSPKYQEIFGAAIGCLACVAAGVATAREAFPRPTGAAGHGGYHDRELAIFLSAECTGKELIGIIVKYLPELTPLRSFMERTVRSKFSEASESYAIYIRELTAACNCDKCNDSPWGTSNNGYCMVIILHLVIRIGQTLSLVNNPSQLQPSRVGLSKLYEELYKSNATPDPIPIGLDQTALSREPESKASMWHILPSVLTLFSKRIPLPIVDLCAYSTDDGVCVYWEALSGSLGGRLSNRVTLIPGQILLDGKRYSKMIDRLHLEPINISLQEGTDTLFVNQGAYGTVTPLPFSHNETSVLLKETTTGLQVAFEIPTHAKNPRDCIYVSPARSLNQYTISKSIISCEGSNCTKHLQNAEVKDTKAGLIKYIYQGLSIDVYAVSPIQQWCLGNTTYVDRLLIYCTENQCIDCCLGSAVEYVRYTMPHTYKGCVIIRAAEE